MNSIATTALSYKLQSLPNSIPNINLPSIPSLSSSLPSNPKLRSQPSAPSLSSKSSRPRNPPTHSSRSRDDESYSQWASRHSPSDTSTPRSTRPRSKSHSQSDRDHNTPRLKTDVERPPMPESSSSYYDKMKAWAASPEGGEIYAEKATESWNYIKKKVVGEKEEGENITSSGYTGQESQGSRMWDSLLGNVQKTVKQVRHKYGDGLAESDQSDYEGESHLTRIMKEHHVSKATKTSDLPRWLFSDAELGSKRAAEDEVKEAKYRKQREQDEKEWAEREEARLREQDLKVKNRRGRSKTTGATDDEYDPFSEENYSSNRDRSRGEMRTAMDDIFQDMHSSRGGRKGDRSTESVDSGYASQGTPRSAADKLKAMRRR